MSEVGSKKADELKTIVNKICNVIEKAYAGDSIIFEHGSYGSSEAGGCIVHAHFHFVPSNINLHQELKVQFSDNKEISIDDLARLSLCSPYLFFQSNDRKGVVYVLSEEKSLMLDQQYFRSMVAMELDDVDIVLWQDVVDSGNKGFVETFQKLKPYFKEL
jgi:hypothetical protein